MAFQTAEHGEALPSSCRSSSTGTNCRRAAKELPQGPPPPPEPLTRASPPRSSNLGVPHIAMEQLHAGAPEPGAALSSAQSTGRMGRKVSLPKLPIMAAVRKSIGALMSGRAAPGPLSGRPATALRRAVSESRMTLEADAVADGEAASAADAMPSVREALCTARAELTRDPLGPQSARPQRSRSMPRLAPVDQPQTSRTACGRPDTPAVLQESRTALTSRTSKAGPADSVSPSVVVRQIVRKLYKRDLGAREEATLLAGCPEIQWLAECALRCPSPAQADEGLLPDLKPFVRLAWCVVLARSKPEKAEQALDMVNSIAETFFHKVRCIKECWHGPYVDPCTGLDFYHCPSAGTSSWHNPTAMPTLVAKVAHTLAGAAVFACKSREDDAAEPTSESDLDSRLLKQEELEDVKTSEVNTPLPVEKGEPLEQEESTELSPESVVQGLESDNDFEPKSDCFSGDAAASSSDESSAAKRPTSGACVGAEADAAPEECSGADFTFAAVEPPSPQCSREEKGGDDDRAPDENAPADTAELARDGSPDARADASAGDSESTAAVEVGEVQQAQCSEMETGHEENGRRTQDDVLGELAHSDKEGFAQHESANEEVKKGKKEKKEKKAKKEKKDKPSKKEKKAKKDGEQATMDEGAAACAISLPPALSTPSAQQAAATSSFLAAVRWGATAGGSDRESPNSEAEVQLEMPAFPDEPVAAASDEGSKYLPKSRRETFIDGIDASRREKLARLGEPKRGQSKTPSGHRTSAPPPPPPSFLPAPRPVSAVNSKVWAELKANSLLHAEPGVLPSS